MSEGLWSILNSWQWSRIGEISNIVGGGTPDAKDETNFDDEGFPWLTPADLTGFEDAYISRGRRSLTNKGLSSSSAKIIKSGSVLYSSRAPNGYCVISLNEVSTSQGFKSFEPYGKILPEFIRYYLINSKDYVESLASGTTFKEISGSKAAEIEIPIAPIPEQKRIVAKIDSLGAKSKRAKDHLNHIPRLVEKYKQAIFLSAFSGRLTSVNKDLRSKKADILNEVVSKREKHIQCSRGTVEEYAWRELAHEPFLLPEGWVWVASENLCTFITKGTTPKSNELNCEGAEIPFIKVYNLTFDGSLDFSIEPTFVPKGIHEGFLKRSKVYKDDVLMNIVGPPLGKVSVVPDTYKEWNVNQAIAIFRSTGSILPKYLAFWLSSNYLTSLAISRSKATVGQSNLTLEICRSLPIPLCSLTEQKEIVRRIETAFNWIDRLAKEATSARKLIDALDKAILTKAFRGELVPQNPNDEPAAALLERIRTQSQSVARKRKA